MIVVVGVVDVFLVSFLSGSGFSGGLRIGRFVWRGLWRRHLAVLRVLVRLGASLTWRFILDVAVFGFGWGVVVRTSCYVVGRG